MTTEIRRPSSYTIQTPDPVNDNGDSTFVWTYTSNPTLAYDGNPNSCGSFVWQGNADGPTSDPPSYNTWSSYIEFAGWQQASAPYSLLEIHVRAAYGFYKADAEFWFSTDNFTTVWGIYQNPWSHPAYTILTEGLIIPPGTDIRLLKVRMFLFAHTTPMTYTPTEDIQLYDVWTVGTLAPQTTSSFFQFF